MLKSMKLNVYIYHFANNNSKLKSQYSVTKYLNDNIDFEMIDLDRKMNY